MVRPKIIVMLLSVHCILSAGISFAEPNIPANEPNRAGANKAQVSSEVKKTQVVIIGTIHSRHYSNPKYSPDILKQIILSLKPDVILNELPLSLVDPNGRPLEGIRGKGNPDGPECWAADDAAMELGIKQIPFDRPDRQENFKKTNYFERNKRSKELMNKWGEQTFREDPNSLDIKIAHLMSYAGQAEDQLFMNSGPEIINSETHDSVIRIKHSLWHDIMPAIWKKYPGWETLVDDSCFEKQQWEDRNRIMVNNIVKAAKEYAGKRLVVVTGATHRYILRDLLKNEPAVELKEYWEITSLGINKPCEPNEPNQPAYLKVIPPEKLKEDLGFLFKTIEEVHPNMYAYTSKEEFEFIRRDLYDKVIESLSVREFYKEVARAIAYLQFGHCLVIPPELQGKFTKSRILPLKLRWDGEDVVVAQDFTEAGIGGGKLLEVDGRKIEELIAEYKMYVPCEGRIGNTSYATRAAGYFLWLEHGEKDFYNLVIRKENEQSLNYQAKTVKYKTIEENESAQGHLNLKEKFAYRYIEESGVGIITINTFTGESRAKFGDFLKSTFSKIKEQGISNLIIDIRENGGGDSRLGDDLLNYLTDKPYKQFEKYKCKISKQLLDPNNNALDKIAEEKPEDLEIGKFVGRDIPLKKPADNSLRYEGRIYVLTGNGTYSSGQSFAAAVKCFQIGTLVGQETGSTTVEYGDMMTFTMPNSGLIFNVPCKYFVEACGKPDGRGVIPDYEVKQRPEDTAKGVDTVLQFTLNLIKDPNFGIRPKIKQIDKTGID